jgi:hypothetical protein
MSGSWQTVYEIASRRHATKRGEDHMTKHAVEVLQLLTVAEAQAALYEANMFVASMFKR